MKLTERQLYLIHRYLDGQCTETELGAINALLTENQEARDFLLVVSEQAIVAGDNFSVSEIAVDRRATSGVWQSPSREYPSRGNPSSGFGVKTEARSRTWLGFSMAACTILFATATAWNVYASFRPGRVPVGAIKHVQGLLDFRGYRGEQASRIEAGQQVYAGDILESKSCDSWLEIDIAEDSRMTLASYSSLRMLQSVRVGVQEYELRRGGLWVDSRLGKDRSVRIITPTATIDASDSTLNIRVTETETSLWVHRGQATVQQILDGQTAKLQAGLELSMSLERSGRLEVRPQPLPVHTWTLRWPLDHQYAYGRILSESSQRPRLQAMPMLWPIPNRDPLLLYVSAIGAWGCSPNPIVVRSGSVLRFQGRNQIFHKVRLGFSTQTLHGVFGGKFEIDIEPEHLGKPGEVWQLDLPIDRFHALYPQLNAKPGGLQLIDVYALTIQDDVGLEILGVELIEPDGSTR